MHKVTGPTRGGIYPKMAKLWGYLWSWQKLFLSKTHNRVVVIQQLKSSYLTYYNILQIVITGRNQAITKTCHIGAQMLNYVPLIISLHLNTTFKSQFQIVINARKLASHLSDIQWWTKIIWRKRHGWPQCQHITDESCFNLRLWAYSKSPAELSACSQILYSFDVRRK